MQILDCLTSAPSLNMTEIAQSVNLTTSTTHRSLANLVAHGLVHKDKESNRYSIGPRVLRLAHAATDNLDIAKLATQYLIALRDRTHETSAVHIHTEGPKRLVLTQVESHHALRRTYTEIGRPVPIHEGAPGKVLLAHLPNAVQEAVLSEPLASATPKTITDPDTLREELARVRDDGYAVSIEERVPGVTSLAVPVFDFSTSVVAAISVSGPSSRVSPDVIDIFVPLAIDAAEQFTVALGGGPRTVTGSV